MLSGLRADGEWGRIASRTDLLPDTRHRFIVDAKDVVGTGASGAIYPDGGLAGPSAVR